MRFRFFFAWIPFFLGSFAAFADDVVPATAYFPVLPFNAPDNTLPQLLPLAMNRPFGVEQSGVTRAIVVIHDASRDATATLGLMSALAGEQNSSTIILAPQFLLPSDIVRFSDFLPDRGQNFAAWQVFGWSSGDDSMSGSPKKRVSSFDALDLLLMYLADKATFPDLQNLVVAGFGEGGSFVQRFAAFSPAPDVLAQQKISVRFVVAGATSFLYQTSARPLGGKKGFGLPDSKACPDVNAYPYGLDNLNPYARRTGANAAKINYALRFITYLNAPLSKVSAPESKCAVLAQGVNPEIRADNYRLYLNSLYGNVAQTTQTFAKTKDGPNNAVSLFGSACGMAALFGDGKCSPSMSGIVR